MRSSCVTSLLAQLCAYNLHIEHKLLRYNQLCVQNSPFVHKVQRRQHLCAQNDLLKHELLSNQIVRDNAECLH